MATDVSRVSFRKFVATVAGQYSFTLSASDDAPSLHWLITESPFRNAVKNGHHNNIMEAVITINTDSLYPKNTPSDRARVISRMHSRHLSEEITLTIVD